MANFDIKTILWANVLALMKHHWDGENLTRLAREAKIGPGTASRIKDARTSVGIDVLSKIAPVFDLHPWHLLVPQLDPRNPPVIWLSRTETELYARLQTAAEELAQYKH